MPPKANNKKRTEDDGSNYSLNSKPTAKKQKTTPAKSRKRAGAVTTAKAAQNKRTTAASRRKDTQNKRAKAISVVDLDSGDSEDELPKKRLEVVNISDNDEDDDNDEEGEVEKVPIKREVVAKNTIMYYLDFPRFPDGNVIIALKVGDADRYYLLHSQVLSRASRWFDSSMRGPMDELDPYIAARWSEKKNVVARYELVQSAHLNEFILERQLLTKYKDTSMKNPVSSVNNKNSTVLSSKRIIIDMSSEDDNGNDLVDRKSNLVSSSDQDMSLQSDYEVDMNDEILLQANDYESLQHSKAKPGDTDAEEAMHGIIQTSEPEQPSPQSEIEAPISADSTSTPVQLLPVDMPQQLPLVQVATPERASDAHALFSEHPQTPKPGSNDDQYQSDMSPLSSLDHLFPSPISSSAKPTTVDELAGWQTEIAPLKSESSEASTSKQVFTVQPAQSAAIGYNTNDNKVDDNFVSSTTPEVHNGSSVQQVATLQPSQNMMRERGTEEAVKMEPRPSIEPSVHPISGPSEELMDAYDNFFSIIYNRPPVLSTTSIQLALSQAEILYHIASLYEAAPITRPSLTSHLFNFGHALYAAIMEDPPRWLQMSIKLKCAPIFKEAMIHICGRYPDYPGTWTIQKKDLDIEVLDLLVAKTTKLRKIMTGVNTMLFTSSIKIGGEQVSVAADRGDTSAWMIVNLWREWFADSLDIACLSNPARLIDASMYRLMGKGGDAYLPLLGVVATVEKVLRVRGTRDDLLDMENNLETMKNYAKSLMKPLCVNHSMLDVEEAGIGYLTCINIEDHELPWAAGKDIEMKE